MAGFTTKVIAQASASASAGATIIFPIELTETSPLQMGAMSVLAGTSGSCILSTSNVRNSSGGVSISSTGPSSSNASFHVVGEPLYEYVISLPGSISIALAGSPTITMTIDALKAKCSSKLADGLIGILVDGDDDFTVGGTLNVGAGQTPGDYTGAFEVIVNYN